MSKRPVHFSLPLIGKGFVIKTNGKEQTTIAGQLTVLLSNSNHVVRVSLPIALTDVDGILEGRAAITSDELKTLLQIKTEAKSSDNHEQKEEQKVKKRVLKPVKRKREARQREEQPVQTRKRKEQATVTTAAQRARAERATRRQQQ